MKKKTKSLTLVLPVRFPKDGKLRKTVASYAAGAEISQNKTVLRALERFFSK